MRVERLELGQEPLGGLRVREGQRLLDDRRDAPVGVGPAGIDPEEERLEHRPLV